MNRGEQQRQQQKRENPSAVSRCPVVAAAGGGEEGVDDGQRDDTGEREDENSGGGDDVFLDQRRATMTAASSAQTAARKPSWPQKTPRLLGERTEFRHSSCPHDRVACAAATVAAITRWCDARQRPSWRSSSQRGRREPTMTRRRFVCVELFSGQGGSYSPCCRSCTAFRFT